MLSVARSVGILYKTNVLGAHIDTNTVSSSRDGVTGGYTRGVASRMVGKLLHDSIVDGCSRIGQIITSESSVLIGLRTIGKWRENFAELGDKNVSDNMEIRVCQGW